MNIHPPQKLELSYGAEAFYRANMPFMTLRLISHVTLIVVAGTHTRQAAKYIWSIH